MEKYTLKDRFHKRGPFIDLGNRLWFQRTDMLFDGCRMFVYFIDNCNNGSTKVYRFDDGARKRIAKGKTDFIGKLDLDWYTAVDPIELPRNVVKGAKRLNLL